MNKEIKNKKISKKALFITLGVILVLAVGAFLLYRYLNPRKIKPETLAKNVCPIEHFGKIEDYVKVCDGCAADAIMAYMYDTNATGRVFTDNWGLERFMLPGKYTSIRMFKDYLRGSLNTLSKDEYPSRLLLGLDPYAIYLQSCSNDNLYRENLEFITDIANNHPYTLIYVYLPEDNAAKWNSLSPEEKEKARISYIMMTRLFTEFPNIWVYYHSLDEWFLYSDSIRNGTENGQIREDIIDHYMTTDISDLDMTYMLNQTNVNDRMDDVIALSEKYNETRAGYADMSGKTVIFLGDSVFGNFRNESSIPAFFSDMTGARVYNLGIGGVSGTSLIDPTTNIGSSFGFITGNTGLDTFERICAGRQFYSSFRAAGNELAGKDGSGYVFVIEFGLNDYFSGLAVDDYKKALKESIRYIKNSYPEAGIVLFSPGYVGIYNDGFDITSDVGSVLEDYRQAARDIAKETGCEVLSLTDDFGFSQDEIYTYLLPDAVHYNEIGRYRIAQVLAEYFK